jgi:hypothetical protein
LKILGLIGIDPNRGDNGIVMAGLETKIPGMEDLGRCVDCGCGPDDCKKFDFEGEEVDLDSLSSRLVAARKAARFKHWSIEWYLLDVDGAILNGGLMLEDLKSGEIGSRGAVPQAKAEVVSIAAKAG